MDIVSSSNVTQGPLDLKNPNHQPEEPSSSAEAGRLLPEPAEKGLSDPLSTASCTCCRECKVFQVLRDFLQPDTNLLLNKAVNDILTVYPVSEDFPVRENPVFGLAVLFVDTAVQIPYYHSAQQKLARLVCAIANEEPVWISNVILK